MKSVLQDWVMNLPLRAQGTLLTCIRGCDVAPKPMYPEKDFPIERQLTAYLRWCIAVPADPREVDYPGAFFYSKLPDTKDWKPSLLEHYPLHWYSHMMHSFEVIGHLHPDIRVQIEAYAVYFRLVRALHLYPETREQMLTRLTEDRILAGTIVS